MKPLKSRRAKTYSRPLASKSGGAFALPALQLVPPLATGPKHVRHWKNGRPRGTCRYTTSLQGQRGQCHTVSSISTGNSEKTNSAMNDRINNLKIGENIHGSLFKVNNSKRQQSRRIFSCDQTKKINRKRHLVIEISLSHSLSDSLN